MTSESVPQRLSDAERDAAIEMLRDHFAAGRLDQVEFGDRMQRALEARFAADVLPLFDDLPDPRPAGMPPVGVPLPAPGEWRAADVAPFAPAASAPDWAPSPGSALSPQVQRWLPMARALLWPVAGSMCLVTGELCWIAVGVIGQIVLTQLTRNQRKPPPYRGQ